MGKEFVNDRNVNFSSKEEKKKFDKKKYINLKLNNKIKLQQWEQKRQKNFQRRYNKEFKKNKTNVSQENFENADISQPKGRLGVVQVAQLELKRRKEEKKQMVKEKLKKKGEIEQAIANYKKKKSEKFKKLSKKTKYGQPVMKDRIQLLYEEIKQKISKE